MWCLEHKSGPSLTTPCPLNSHNSWRGSDLQQNPRSCNQTCSVCFGHDHLLVGFLNVFLCYLLPIWAKICCTNLRAQHSSTSLGWWGAETAKHPTCNSSRIFCARGSNITISHRSSPLPNASPALWSPEVPLSSWPPRCRSFAPFVPPP